MDQRLGQGQPEDLKVKSATDPIKRCVGPLCDACKVTRLPGLVTRALSLVLWFFPQSPISNMQLQISRTTSLLPSSQQFVRFLRQLRSILYERGFTRPLQYRDEVSGYYALTAEQRSGIKAPVTVQVGSFIPKAIA